MKKRLLITGSTFPRYKQDTEPRFVLDLAKSLLPYADVTVLVPAAPDALDEEMMEGVHVVRYHYFPVHQLETLCYPGAIVPRIREKKVRVLLVPWLFCALFRHLRKMRKQYDLVLANWLIPQGIVQSYVSTPYYVVGHGGDVTSLNKGIFKALKKRCIRRAQGFTAVSEHLRRVMLQTAGYESSESATEGALTQSTQQSRMKQSEPLKNSTTEKSNSRVISMGCNTENFGQEYRVAQYFDQGKDRIVLFAGRLAEKKGVTYLIEAMRNVPDARLVIVGDGPLRQELEEQAAKLQQERPEVRVTFLGARTHEELKTIYASSDLFVMPSVTAKDGDQEGFGLVMLEAFASGLPVVASDSGGIKDLVKEDYNGCLVPEKDSRQIAERINQILNNAGLYEKLQKNALQTAAEYDYKEIGRRYAEFMQLI